MAKKKQYNPKEDRVFHITSIIWLLLAMAVCWVIDLLLPLRWVVVLSVGPYFSKMWLARCSLSAWMKTWRQSARSFRM